MNEFIFDMLPGRVIFGAGTLAQLPDEVARLGAEETVTYEVEVTSSDPAILLSSIELQDVFTAVSGVNQGAITNVTPSSVNYNSGTNTFTNAITIRSASNEASSSKVSCSLKCAG